MRFLVDTMVLSEARRREPDPAVVAWLRSTPEADLSISVLTLGEIESGIARLADPVQRRRLQAWLEDELRPRFGERVLPVDADVAAIVDRRSVIDRPTARLRKKLEFGLRCVRTVE